VKASRPRLGLRLLWPALLVGSIIYAAGPNGSWMARQFTAPVPPWWGWFGAVLLGLAIFGGIKLATAGRRAIGIAIALVGGIVAIAVDAQYFAAAGHGLVMAALLGLFPTLLAVLAGIVEGIEVSAQESTVEADSRAERERATEAERLRLEWELREAAKDRAAARRQDRGGLRTPAAIPARQSSPVTPDRSDSAPDSDRTAPDKPNFSDQTKRAAIAYIQELAGEVTAADLADRFGVTERTGRRYLAAYRSNGHHKEPIL
jgi:hypothetical protein